ncbi:MAG: metalloregulator ArsR/SmtB family transcription factor [Pseudomonadota bacterium]
MSKTKKLGDAKRRRAIIDHLKQEGPSDAALMADRLGISAMAVRQHLYGLRDEKLVDFEEEARPLGRPAKLWRLTPAADRFFPDGHAELTLGLIGGLKNVFGDEGMEKMLALRAKDQISAYQRIVGEKKSLKGRLVALAKLRTDEGYMAAVEGDGSGVFCFVENHCPICAAASACQGLCAMELEVFQAVLGPGVSVERTDHILAGARRCAYRVEAR